MPNLILAIESFQILNHFTFHLTNDFQVCSQILFLLGVKKWFINHFFFSNHSRHFAIQNAFHFGLWIFLQEFDQKPSCFQQKLLGRNRIISPNEELFCKSFQSGFSLFQDQPFSHNSSIFFFSFSTAGSISFFQLFSSSFTLSNQFNNQQLFPHFVQSLWGWLSAEISRDSFFGVS